jgi:transcriptional regulator with XRE-family HTH domain
MKPKTHTIGPRLRSLRVRQGWTLKQMSQRCGIPLSTLAKVEHDRLTLTYDKLLQVSQRLKIPISELFAEPESESEPAVTARRSVGRLSDAVRVKTRNYDYHYLCPELRRKRGCESKALRNLGTSSAIPGKNILTSWRVG